MHSALATDDLLAIAMTDAESRIGFGDMQIATASVRDVAIEGVFEPDEITPARRAAFPTALARCPLPQGDRGRSQWLRNYTRAIAGGSAYTRTGAALAPVDRATRAAHGSAFWPPAPRPLPPITAPVATLPQRLLPEPLRPWLVDVAERVFIPLEYVAAPAIIAMATVVGRTVGIFPKRRDDWLVVPNLWGGVVGRPGLMKSAAIQEAMRPIRRLVVEAGKQFKADVLGSDLARATAEAKIAALKAQAHRAAKDGDDASLARLAQEQATLMRAIRDSAPHERRYLTQDGTVEKIGELLIENRRGLLIVRDELAGWMRSLDKKGREGDREFYLESWNGTGDYTYDRIGRGTLHIPALTLSICGGLQPGKLQGYVAAMLAGGKADDGLLQRFQLTVWPDEPGEWRNVDRWPDKEARNRAFRIFADLDTLSPEAIGAESGEPDEIPALRFAPDGQELFDDWRTNLERRLRSPEIAVTPAFESHLAKYRSLMPSLALLFHLVELVETSQRGPVSLASARIAAEWCDFLEPHAQKVFAGVINVDIAAAHALGAKIRAGAVTDGMTVRDVSRREWAGLAREGAVHGALTVLQEAGWARCELRCDTGGRPSDVIRIHPALRKLK